MTRNSKTILKISLVSPMVLPMIFFSSISLANEIDNPAKEYDSMYMYNALENKVNFFSTKNQVAILLGENIADNDNTKKLENITEKQTDSIEKSDQAMSTIEDTTWVRTFLLGNSLGVLRFQVVQMKDETTSLEALALKPEYAKNQIQIASQVKLLKEKQEQVENFIREKENEFSLFGWLANSL